MISAGRSSRGCGRVPIQNGIDQDLLLRTGELIPTSPCGKREGWLRAIFAPIFGLLLLGSPALAAEGRVVVASKIDTEGALLGNLIVELLQARGLAVENKLQLGPTNIVRA